MEYPVALVCMPFFGAERPSIQVGLLHSLAARAGCAVESFHLNLDLARRMGAGVYEALCAHRRHMTGEWLFSYAAFGEQAASEDEYFAAFPQEAEWVRSTLGKELGYLTHLRREVIPEFVDSCAALDWDRFRLVGFTSTFQQNVASLALARRIKERCPATQTIFGGANFEDAMGPEYARSFPFIDFAIVGEGDVSFPMLLQKLARGEPLDEVPGLIRRCGDRIVAVAPGAPVADLNALPPPSYHEYFARREQLGLSRSDVWSIPFETSRGCWWGAKHHCTFCGLNGLGMNFRAKRSELVQTEIATLAREYGVTFFEATDNIMDMKYVDGLFGALAEEKLDYQFFYEVKANLTKAQIQRLRDGGVRWVQPGIESLSTAVLQLMRKGATMLQNVRLLKWCRYYGIRVSWNLIWGFPGERAEHYEQEFAVLKAITHLEPPGGCGRIWLERFSPYFVDYQRFASAPMRPEASYAYAYPPHVNLDNAAYFFDYEFDDTAANDTHAPTGALVTEWRTAAASASPDSLVYRRSRDVLFVDDHRGHWPVGTHVFEGAIAELYLFCDDSARTIDDAAGHLGARGYDVSAADVHRVLNDFVERGLAVSEGDRYLSLALPSQPGR